MLFKARGLKRLHIGPLDLDLADRECLCVTGPSGAGKSLLLRMLADLDPHEGESALDGVRQSDMPAPEWRRKVCLLAADSQWWEARVADHFPADDAGGLERFGFPRGAADWEVERLSSGEKQRLALARVLTLEPRVLLLDEPTANLDADNAARIEAIIRDWCKQDGHGVIWVSHDRDQVKRVCSRELKLSEGRWTA